MSLFLGILLLASSPTPSPESSATLAQKTDIAEVRIRAQANRFFDGVWTKARDGFTGRDVSAAELRSVTLWSIAGVSLGLCSDFAKPTDFVDWGESFERITSEINSADVIRLFHKGGLNHLRSGLETASTPEKKASDCPAEIAAVRRIIASL